MSFVTHPVANLPAGKWDWVGAISLNGSGAPAVAAANAHDVRLSTGAAAVSFPGGPSNVAPAPESILPVDFNYDFKTDLVLAGAGGLRFLRQDKPDAFTDVTAQTKLPRVVIDGPYTGVWAADIEADGDLDVVVGAKDGLPLVLRNNGDGTFLPIHPFCRPFWNKAVCVGRLEWRRQPRMRL